MAGEVKQPIFFQLAAAQQFAMPAGGLTDIRPLSAPAPVDVFAGATPQNGSPIADFTSAPQHPLTRSAPLSPDMDEDAQFRLYWKFVHTSCPLRDELDIRMRAAIDRGDHGALRETLAECPFPRPATRWIDYAAQYGTPEALRALLEAGFFTARRRPHDWEARPLHCVAGKEVAKKVAILVNAGFDVNDGGFHGEPPLSSAMTRGNLAHVKALLAAGARADVAMLRWAIRYHSFELLEALLEAGADAKGENLMLEAMWSNNVKILQLLLAHGADPTALCRLQGSSKRPASMATPMELALLQKNPEGAAFAVELFLALLKRGVVVDKRKLKQFGTQQRLIGKANSCATVRDYIDLVALIPQKLFWAGVRRDGVIVGSLDRFFSLPHSDDDVRAVHNLLTRTSSKNEFEDRLHVANAAAAAGLRQRGSIPAALPAFVATIGIERTRSTQEFEGIVRRIAAQMPEDAASARAIRLAFIEGARQRMSADAYIRYVSALPNNPGDPYVSREEVIVATLDHFFVLKPNIDQRMIMKGLFSNGGRAKYERAEQVFREVERLVPADEPQLSEIVSDEYLARIATLSASWAQLEGNPEALKEFIAQKLSGTDTDVFDGIYLAAKHGMRVEGLGKQLLARVAHAASDDSLRALSLWAVTKLYRKKGMPVVDPATLLELAFLATSKNFLRVINWALYQWQIRGIVTHAEVAMLNRARRQDLFTAVTTQQRKVIYRFAVDGRISGGEELLDAAKLRTFVKEKIVDGLLQEKRTRAEGVAVLEEVHAAFPRMADDEELRASVIEALRPLAARKDDLGKKARRMFKQFVLPAAK